MTSYALLLRANANRVYGAVAPDLAAAELAVLDRTQLGGVVRRSEPARIAGVEYLLVDAATELTEEQLAIVSNLSSLHAVYEVAGDLLRPHPVTPVARADDDIVTIQRYAGKTNEAFTHLLVNLALAEAGDALRRVLAGERVRLLDPACGRGTTLNRAVVYGLDACGIEIDQRDVEHYTVFLLTWLKDKRLKHHLDQAKLRKGRPTPAHRITVTYGATRDRATHRVVDVIHDDMLDARTHLKPRSVDVLVCDLPYGVQHGSRPTGGGAERGPAGLVEQALPVWFDLLRPGAALALGWNRRTLPRPDLVHLLGDAGFELRGPPGDDALVHRVDRAIQRDAVVAIRPG
ncbi:MAG: TRM11 family SAM-dependent methyltransferase [Acidimicrobiales bacterium]